MTRFAEYSHANSLSILDDATRPSIWGRLREALPLFRESSPAATILRLSILPSHHAEAITVLDAVARAAKLPLALVARATGTLYVALLPKSIPESMSESIDDAWLENLTLLVQEVFTLGRSRKGDATFLWAPPALRNVLSVQAPSPAALHLMRRLKSAFDPHNVFAPNRLLPQI